MKENKNWNYIMSPEKQAFPWLYPNMGIANPYHNQVYYRDFWNYPERMEAEVDARRLQELFPVMARRLQPYVEEVCSQLDYQGSMMYDEYPDRLSLMIQAKKIWNKANDGEQFDEENVGWEQTKDLIGVLLLHEMFRRRRKRCEHFGNGTSTFI